MREVVITSAVRTAIGNFLGVLSPLSATELGGQVIEEAIRRSNIQKEDELVAPIQSIPKTLKKAGLSLGDINFF